MPSDKTSNDKSLGSEHQQHTFFYSTRGVYGQMYSCPDFFRLSADKFVFMHLDPFDPYFIGTYVPVADGGPRFVPSAPFNHTTSMKSESGDLMGPNRALGGGLSIMKTGGVGSNNVMNASSRRVYFGTIELRPLTIPNPAPDENTTHSNYIVCGPIATGAPCRRLCSTPWRPRRLPGLLRLARRRPILRARTST